MILMLCVSCIQQTKRTPTNNIGKAAICLRLFFFYMPQVLLRHIFGTIYFLTQASVLLCSSHIWWSEQVCSRIFYGQRKSRVSRGFCNVIYLNVLLFSDIRCEAIGICMFLVSGESLFFCNAPLFFVHLGEKGIGILRSVVYLCQV